MSFAHTYYAPKNSHLKPFSVIPGGGDVSGRVTRAEWREHHADVSAIIHSDDEFSAYLRAVWQPSNITSGNSSVGIDGSDTHHVPVSQQDDSGCASGHRDSAARPCGLSRGNDPCDNGTNGGRATHKGNDAHHGNRGLVYQGSRTPQGFSHSADAAVTATRSSRPHGPREAWGARIPRTINRPGTVERLDSRGDDAAGATAAPPGVRCLLDRARVSLAGGGVMGPFRLLKGLREMDQNGDGTVTLSGFQKAVRDAGLGLKDEEIGIVFEVSANKKTDQSPIPLPSWAEIP